MVLTVRGTDRGTEIAWLFSSAGRLRAGRYGRWCDGSSGDEAIPCRNRCCWVGERELRRTRTAKNAQLSRYHASEPRILTANNGRVPVRRGHQPCRVAPEDEFTK